MSRLRSLIRSGPVKIVRWEPMPPEAPHVAYHVIDTTDPRNSRAFPTHQQAVAFADKAKCPLLAPLPFDKEQP
jgi:hypothetical protein